MKFYNRESELALLDRIENRSVDTAQMTFVVGRRRIGKTSLLIKATEKQNMLYFLLPKKRNIIMCRIYGTIKG